MSASCSCAGRSLITSPFGRSTRTQRIVNRWCVRENVSARSPSARIPLASSTCITCRTSLRQVPSRSTRNTPSSSNTTNGAPRTRAGSNASRTIESDGAAGNADAGCARVDAADTPTMDTANTAHDRTRRSCGSSRIPNNNPGAWTVSRQGRRSAHRQPTVSSPSCRHRPGVPGKGQADGATGPAFERAMHGPGVTDEVLPRPGMPREELERQLIALEPVAGTAGRHEVARIVGTAVRTGHDMVERGRIEREGVAQYTHRWPQSRSAALRSACFRHSRGNARRAGRETPAHVARD